MLKSEIGPISKKLKNRRELQTILKLPHETNSSENEEANNETNGNSTVRSESESMSYSIDSFNEIDSETTKTTASLAQPRSRGTRPVLMQLLEKIVSKSDLNFSKDSESEQHQTCTNNETFISSTNQADNPSLLESSAKTNSMNSIAEDEERIQ